MDGFVHVSEDELTLGLAYALDKHGVKLSRDSLRILFNETGQVRLTLSGKNAYNQAKRQVLDDNLPQSTKEERRRFVAYSSAIGKIASRRAVLARRQRKPQKKLTEIERIKGQLFLRGKQYAFV